jgi:hypothetical protein
LNSFEVLFTQMKSAYHFVRVQLNRDFV